MKNLHFILIILLAFSITFDAEAQPGKKLSCGSCGGKGTIFSGGYHKRTYKYETKRVKVTLPGEVPARYEDKKFEIVEWIPHRKVKCGGCNGTGVIGVNFTPLNYHPTEKNKGTDNKKTTPKYTSPSPSPSIPKNGEHKTYYSNGKIKSTGKYVDGKQSGNWKYYHENGNLKTAYSFFPGKTQYEVKHYYESGKLKTEGINGGGLWKEYHENGKLKSQGRYGGIAIKYGHWKEYYSNGNLKSEGDYNKSGKREGNWKFYYENGKLHQTGNFDNEITTGKWKEYYHNGNLKSEGTYDKENKANGEWKFYNADGTIKEKKNYNNGIEHKNNNNIISADTQQDVYNITFKTGTSALSDNGKLAADRLATDYKNKRKTAIGLTITHPDNTTSKTIAENRLALLKRYLVSKGVPQIAIHTKAQANKSMSLSAALKLETSWQLAQNTQKDNVVVNTGYTTPNQQALGDCELFRRLWAGSANGFKDIQKEIKDNKITFSALGKPVSTTYKPGAFAGEISTPELIFYSGTSETRAKAIYQKLKAALQKCPCEGGTPFTGKSPNTDMVKRKLDVAGYVGKNRGLSKRAIEAGLADNRPLGDMLSGSEARLFTVYLQAQ